MIFERKEDFQYMSTYKLDVKTPEYVLISSDYSK